MIISRNKHLNHMKYVVFIIVMSFSMISFSNDNKDIKCEYQFGEKQIELQSAEKSIVKTFSRNGQNFIIGIKDTDNFNEADDYLVIKEKDKTMTYSLKCSVD